ncbi:MAG: TonB-dependent receptor plug domain-containing protein [Opitutaceae bacterium]|nr:TonB-dependent receptor plug domain-containing protein [Opitutaceae bacterium]
MKTKVYTPAPHPSIARPFSTPGSWLRFLPIGIVIAICPGVGAQATSSPQSKSDTVPAQKIPVVAATPDAESEGNGDAKDVVALNPFLVNASQDTGYTARSSLAGTRLNTLLKDIASSISVVTKEFLEDTNSTSLENLLVYTANTEVPGIGGNFANPNASRVAGGVMAASFSNPEAYTRVRGLAAADLTRDFFSTSIPMDSYNTSRVVINRGANAILYGLGSPAGIIDNQTIKPLFKSQGMTSYEYGSYGTRRGVVDLEKEIVRKKLSLRIALLDEDTRYQQKPAKVVDRRITTVGEWRPFKNTAVRVSYEYGKMDGNYPRPIPPQDQVSRWFDVSPTGVAKPVKDPYNKGTLNMYNAAGRMVDNLYWGPAGWGFEPVIFFPNADASVAGGALPNGADGFVPLNHPILGADASNGVSYQAFATIRGLNQLLANMVGAPKDQNGNLKSVTRNFYVNEVVQDTSIFDFRNLLIDGPNKSEDRDFQVLNGAVEQTFLQGNAGLTYQFNKEKSGYTRHSILGDGSQFSGLAVDVNGRLPSGEVNPNFGRLFFSSGSLTKSIINAERENHAFTGFYKLDLEKYAGGFWRHLLGNHTLTAFYSKSERNNESYNFSRFDMDGSWLLGKGNFHPNPLAFSALGTHVYVSPSIANQSTAAGAHASNMRTKIIFEPEYSITYLNRDTHKYTVGTFGNEQNVPWGATLSKQDIDSRVLILHSRFLNNNVVATYGYREDDVGIWTNNQPPLNINERRNISPSVFHLPSDPTFTSSSNSRSLGLVAHAPEAWLNRLGARGLGLSLYYATSDNAQVGVERKDLNGDTLPPVAGDTEEIGFAVSFADGKFAVRVNKYETLETGLNSGLTGQFSGFMNFYLREHALVFQQSIIDANAFNQPDIGHLANYDPFKGSEYLRDLIKFSRQPFEYTFPPGLVFPTNLQSKGWEIEGVANLTPNWRLTFNVANQEVISTNTAPLLREFIAKTVEPVLAEFGKFPVDILGAESLKSAVERAGLIATKTTLLSDGAPKTDEIRPWRANLVTNYTFDRRSRFKGFNVGGAVRWQDKIGIGFPVIQDPALGIISDLANPIYGPSSTNVDAWIGWMRKLGPRFGNTVLRLQLNVRNLLNDDDLIPVVANPDLTIPVVRVPEERAFALRASLSF